MTQVCAPPGRRRRRFLPFAGAALVHAALIGGPLTASAQTGATPPDAAVVEGGLTNGFRYTMAPATSAMREGESFVWFSIDRGSSSQAVDQGEAAHMVEHVWLRRWTVSCPYIVSDGSGRNASVGRNSIYFFSFVRTEDVPELVACLRRIQRDSITREEFERERRAVANETRRGGGPSLRDQALDALKPTFGSAWLASTASVTETLQLRDPGPVRRFAAENTAVGLQSLVIVGDVDRRAVIERIAQSFATDDAPLPVTQDAPPRIDGPQVLSYEDPETPAVQLSVLFTPPAEVPASTVSARLTERLAAIVMARRFMAWKSDVESPVLRISFSENPPSDLFWWSGLSGYAAHFWLRPTAEAAGLEAARALAAEAFNQPISPEEFASARDALAADLEAELTQPLRLTRLLASERRHSGSALPVLAAIQDPATLGGISASAVQSRIRSYYQGQRHFALGLPAQGRGSLPIDGQLASAFNEGGASRTMAGSAPTTAAIPGRAFEGQGRSRGVPRAVDPRPRPDDHGQGVAPTLVLQAGAHDESVSITVRRIARAKPDYSAARQYIVDARQAAERNRTTSTEGETVNLAAEGDHPTIELSARDLAGAVGLLERYLQPGQLTPAEYADFLVRNRLSRRTSLFQSVDQFTRFTSALSRGTALEWSPAIPELTSQELDEAYSALFFNGGGFEITVKGGFDQAEAERRLAPLMMELEARFRNGPAPLEADDEGRVAPPARFDVRWPASGAKVAIIWREGDRSPEDYARLEPVLTALNRRLLERLRQREWGVYDVESGAVIISYDCDPADVEGLIDATFNELGQMTDRLPLPSGAGSERGDGPAGPDPSVASLFRRETAIIAVAWPAAGSAQPQGR